MIMILLLLLLLLLSTILLHKLYMKTLSFMSLDIDSSLDVSLSFRFYFTADLGLGLVTEIVLDRIEVSY